MNAANIAAAPQGAGGWRFDLFTNWVGRTTSSNVTANATLVSRPNSEREKAYSGLEALVGELALVDPESPFFVDQDSAAHALRALSWLRGRYAAPPKLLPLDGDSVTLTWDKGAFSRYLTLSGSDARVLDLCKVGLQTVKCSYEVNFDDTVERDKWLTHIAGSSTSASSPADNVR